MDEPLSWRAVQAIVSMLRKIDGADGWHTDLGTHKIHDDRSAVPNPAEPYTWVVTDDITTDINATGRSKRSVTGNIGVFIDFAIPASATNPELVAHRARADIVRALSDDLRGQAPGITSLAVEETRITQAVLNGTELVVAQVLARAGLTESFSMPA